MKRFNIIYADPPWQYKNYNYEFTKAGDKAKRGCRKEYPLMNMNAIKQLNVAELAADDCVLFLWVTFPLLQEGLDTISAWGFEYKTIAFNWIKRYPKSGTWFWGMGNWTRSNSEICLMGTRGKPKRASASVHQLVDGPVGKHSEKPPMVRDKIVELCGDLPRIELFARQAVDGWDSWGNEIETNIVL